MQAHDEHITTAPRDAGAMDHSAMGRGPTGAGLPVTRAQLTVVSLTTVLALVAALIFSVGYTNLTLSAHDVGGAVMPPGMIMPRDMPGEAMREMSAGGLRGGGGPAPPHAPREPRRVLPR